MRNGELDQNSPRTCQAPPRRARIMWNTPSCTGTPGHSHGAWTRPSRELLRIATVRCRTNSHRGLQSSHRAYTSSPESQICVEMGGRVHVTTRDPRPRLNWVVPPPLHGRHGRRGRSRGASANHPSPNEPGVVTSKRDAVGGLGENQVVGPPTPAGCFIHAGG